MKRKTNCLCLYKIFITEYMKRRKNVFFFFFRANTLLLRVTLPTVNDQSISGEKKKKLMRCYN